MRTETIGLAEVTGDHRPLGGARHRVVALARGVENADTAQVEHALSELASSRRILAPIGWTMGTLLLVFQGLQAIVVNWRLTLIELTPAIWIGLTWWDLRVHALRKLELTTVDGLALVAVAVGVIGITVACYWCNAVFAMAVGPGASGSLRDAFTRARVHASYINRWGFGVGTAHAVVSTVVVRLGLLAFSLAMAAVAVVMMISFVTVPASLLGLKTKQPVSEKLSRTAVGGVLSAVAQTPGFLLNRVGLLMLSVRGLLIPGVAVFAVGVALQTAAVSSVSAVKLSTQFVSATRRSSSVAPSEPSRDDP